MSDPVEKFTKNKEDEELCELMNSAMADLGKSSNNQKPKTSDDDLDAFMEQLDEQAMKNASENFENMLETIMKKVEEERKESNEEPNEEDKMFFEDMKKFMTTANSINNGCNEEEMKKIMEEFQDPNSFMKNFTEMLMEEMTNKDTMYAPMKEMKDKFPQLIEKVTTEGNMEEIQKYKNQQAVVEKICLEFEREDYNDNDEEHKSERILLLTKLFNELHSFGFVPTELTPNVENMGDIDNCSIM
uniref:Peroxin-19 n=1 Tax=Parastrongyloides trichosuri TaxID=131310 RepID=A0A0N4ZFR2_PARTI